MFYEIALKHSAPLKDFQPFSPITDRSSWNSLDPEWKEEAVKLGETYLGYQYPYLTATDFMDFTKTGNRVRYESKFFAKRHALSALILAECAENKGRFYDDIINGIFSICDETAWQLPPHNSYIRDTPQLPLPDVTAPVLDLFACETGAILATAYYLLVQELDQISPFITKRILYEIQQRILYPYLNHHFWWMGNGQEPMNNWTIWCTQNVLLSVFLTKGEEYMKDAVFQKACRSIDYFLAEYGDDGCCDEGAQYYRHAGLCLFNVMELCNTVTSDAFAALYQNSKLRNMASYILNAHIQDKYYVNFADCSPIAGRAGVREFLFAKRIQSEAMMCFAASDFKAGLPDSLLLPSENNLYYRLQNAFTIKEIKAYDTSLPLCHSDIYYPSVGLFAVRDPHLYLAVKAGDNADSHNHNDTGSFTIYKDGKPMFIDVGVESYTKKTFSPQRYEIWTMQSAYHNLPTINGFMQKNGEEYQAKQVSYRISDSLCEIEMDIAEAYPKECNLLTYHRHALLHKEKEIVIKDFFTFRETPDTMRTPNQVILSIMTYENPILQHRERVPVLQHCQRDPLLKHCQCDPLLKHCQRDLVVKPCEHDPLLAIGTLGTLKVTGGILLDIEEIPITDPRLKQAWEHEIYRILILADSSGIELTIT
jgi:hypothetical protein